MEKEKEPTPQPKQVEVKQTTTTTVFDSAAYGLIECPDGFAQIQSTEDEEVVYTVAAHLLGDDAKLGSTVEYLGVKAKIVAYNAPK